jgi:hypothetical protein
MSKPRPPKFNRERLRQSMDQSEGEKLLQKLADRLEILEDLLKRKKTNTTYVAFEALTNFFHLHAYGLTDAQLKETWPDSWGQHTITVPTALLREIAEGWVDYLKAPSGTTLGEAMGLEGGGQGRQPLKSTAQQESRDLARVNAVLVEYTDASLGTEPISLQAAQERVAEERGESLETIRKAHKKHYSTVKEFLTKRGFFEPDKDRG